MISSMNCMNFATKLYFVNNRVLFRHLPSRLPKLCGHLRYCFTDSYNSEEKNRILNIINTGKVEDFHQFGVSKKSITSLLKLQKEKGLLKSLDELKPVFSTKVLDKMFSSMLNKGNWTSGTAIYPALNVQQISEFKSVLSFIVSGDCVPVCSIQRNGGALKVQSLYIIKYSSKPKMHFLAVLNEIKEVVLKAPECDLCITEDFPANNISPNTFNFQLQMGQTRSMFLGFKSAMPNPPTIIAIKRLAVARLFNTFIDRLLNQTMDEYENKNRNVKLNSITIKLDVNNINLLGSEKVSGQPVAEKLLAESPNLKLKPGILEDFMVAEPSTKELLSNVFLLNLSYWKLTKQFNSQS